MKYLFLLALVIILIASACGPATDKQWYKPNADYTAAEFERDRVACSPKKNNVLDETCMKERGWLPLSGDTGPAVKAPSLPPRQKGGKY
ncbi:MAG TPA: hypothetical protein VGT00_21230 [Methylomirabilota bacterium]|jgi:hypothetical protein|nr:hypothetical protein [Methylomirabilota bacterium]